ncbi:MAG: orotate phosphoribosyltransferase [Pseudomonadota bacterium]
MAASDLSADAARLVARALLDIDAVHCRADEPYTLTSGLASPVYVDCRRVISYPRARKLIIGLMAAKLARTVGVEAFDAVAGGETAGIPYAAWLAEDMGLPMLYVRKKPKGFGRNAQIEGAMADGARVLLVEDLATDGGSKLRFAEALREAGGSCAHAVVVFYYGIFGNAPAVLADAGLSLHHLATWWDVLEVSRKDGRFDPATLDTVEAFLKAPLDWSRAHGGVGELASGAR